MKKIVSICLLALTSIAVSAGTSLLRTLFIEMPDTILPYISKNNRLDFLDFMDSDMRADVTNGLGGRSIMKVLTDDSIRISLNEACRVDILLLDLAQPVDSSSHVVALVRTTGVEDDLKESSTDFYSVKWQKLAEKPQLTEESQERLSQYAIKPNYVNYISKKINKQ